MKLLFLIVGTACAVPLENAIDGLDAKSVGVDIDSELGFSSEMYTSTNSTERGRMQKNYLDRLNALDFGRGMKKHPNATLLQKGWLDGLRNQINDLISANNHLNSQIVQKVSMVASLSSQIGEIHEVYNELTVCAAEIPGVEDPWASIHSLAVAYKEKGYPGVANYVEGHLETFVREASKAMDFKQPVTKLMDALDSAKDIQLIKNGQLDDVAAEELVRLGMGVVEDTLAMIPSYTCFKDSLFDGMDTGATLDKVVGMVVRMAKEVHTRPTVP